MSNSLRLFATTALLAAASTGIVEPAVTAYSATALTIPREPSSATTDGAIPVHELPTERCAVEKAYVTFNTLAPAKRAPSTAFIGMVDFSSAKQGGYQ